jgi:AraC family transcriptional regulator of adaptative response / DNA-3-methyladenine glycosylase II
MSENGETVVASASKLRTMDMQPEHCYRALTARDARFDGLFFVGVSTTGIYCRPVCPARTPRSERCHFFSHAAGAEAAGFRPCLRCRPELAPGSAPVDAVSRIARAAAARIEAGALNEHSLDELAAEFELSSRQLRRVIEQELGVTPVELAQTQRLLLAKRLLTDTELPMTEVAFASGFASLRRFNDLFRARYRLSPTGLRSRAGQPRAQQDSLELKLAYRAPLHWESLAGFLAGRGASAVERLDGPRYWRTIELQGKRGWVSAEPWLGESALRLSLSLSLVPVLQPLLSRLRQMFDLNAEPALIDAHLAQDELLRPLLKRTPGLRVPGCFDGFELAMRAILGQRISVRAASTLAGRIATHLGEPITTPIETLNRLSPGAGRLAGTSVAELGGLGIGRQQAEAIRALARACADGRLRLEPGADAERMLDQLRALPGVGEWTAQYVAMRALRQPDAFPHADLGLRKALTDMPPGQILARAEPWRPWRAYAAFHLWASLIQARVQ